MENDSDQLRLTQMRSEVGGNGALDAAFEKSEILTGDNGDRGGDLELLPVIFSPPVRREVKPYKRNKPTFTGFLGFSKRNKRLIDRKSVV